MEMKKASFGILGLIIALIIPSILTVLGSSMEGALGLSGGFLENLLLGWIRIIGLAINLVLAFFLYKSKKSLAIGLIIGTIIAIPIMILFNYGFFM